MYKRNHGNESINHFVRSFRNNRASGDSVSSRTGYYHPVCKNNTTAMEKFYFANLTEAFEVLKDS